MYNGSTRARASLFLRSGSTTVVDSPNLKIEHRPHSSDSWVGTTSYVDIEVNKWYFFMFSWAYEGGSVIWTECNLYDSKFTSLLNHNNPYSSAPETTNQFGFAVERFSGANNDMDVEVMAPVYIKNTDYTDYDYGHNAFFKVPGFAYCDVLGSLGTFLVYDTLYNGYVDVDVNINDDILSDTFDILGYTDDIPGIEIIATDNNTLLESGTYGLSAISTDIGTVTSDVADVATDVDYSVERTARLLDEDYDIDEKTDSLVRLASVPTLVDDELNPGPLPPVYPITTTPGVGPACPAVNWDSYSYSGQTPTVVSGAPGT